jgi:hypothetical protein
MFYKISVFSLSSCFSSSSINQLNQQSTIISCTLPHLNSLQSFFHSHILSTTSNNQNEVPNHLHHLRRLRRRHQRRSPPPHRCVRNFLLCHSLILLPSSTNQLKANKPSRLVNGAKHHKRDLDLDVGTEIPHLKCLSWDGVHCIPTSLPVEAREAEAEAEAAVKVLEMRSFRA